MSLSRKKEHNPFTGEVVDDTPKDYTEKLRYKGYSSYYHKYFEGWYEHQITDSKGRQKIERIYAGDTYRHKLTDRQWVFLKFTYTVIFFTSVYCYVTAAAETVSGNYLWYMIIATALGAFAQFVLLYQLVIYLISRRDLTIRGYKDTHNAFSRYSMIAACGVLLPALVMILYAFVSAGTAEWQAEFTFILRCCMSSILLWMLWFTEQKKITYDVIPFRDTLPSDAIMM